MIVELLIFTTVVSLISLYFNYKERVEYFSSFKKRGIPGPEPNLFLGNYLEFKKYKDKIFLIEKWNKQYGSVLGYFYGRKRVVLLTDVDMINQVFITNSKIFYNREDFALNAKYLIDSVLALKDERWVKVRRLLTPIFSHGKVHSGVFDPELMICLNELQKEINKRIEKDDGLIELKGRNSVELDVYKLMQSFTLDVISRTSFGMVEDVYEPNNGMVELVKEYFLFAGNIFVELGSLIPIFKALLTFINNNLTSGRLVDMLTAKFKEHINVFLKNYQKSSDEATNEKLNENKTDSGNKAKVLTNLLRKFAEKEISEHEFIGNLLLILLAGYETTANATSYGLYLLAKHPEIQEKLREDVNKYGIESKYLDMVWYETLRYYPPVSLFVTRKTKKDCVINGVQFFKDDVVQAPVRIIHHNPDYWPEPEVFRPERFSPEERLNHHSCQFLTYGIGQRICLGLNFANYESKMLLAKVVKEFKLEFCEKTPDPLEFVVSTVISNPSTPIVLRFTKIESGN